MQVLSRFVLVWGIVYPFPHLARSTWYSSMLLAWSVTEVIRYSYFALNLSGIQPKPLVWLRYNTFFVLYPIGITSECALIYLSTGPYAKLNPLLPAIGYMVLAIYVPGTLVAQEKCKDSILIHGRLLYSLHLHDGAKEKGHAPDEGRRLGSLQDAVIALQDEV